MKELWIFLGLVTMTLGIIGIILPVLPTTPFFLVTTYSFTKGSTRFHRWFTNIPFVQKYLSKMEAALYIKSFEELWGERIRIKYQILSLGRERYQWFVKINSELD